VPVRGQLIEVRLILEMIVLALEHHAVRFPELRRVIGKRLAQVRTAGVG
jgi:hypothetical protein